MKRKSVRLLIALLMFLPVLCAGCAKREQKEGVRLIPNAVLPLSDELLLEKQDGYDLYCLVVTVENLGDYEIPFSATNDITFQPEGTVSVLYGGFDRIGHKTQDIVPPHEKKQMAVPFLCADPDAVTEIVYDTKQPDKTVNVTLPIQMDELNQEMESGRSSR